MSYDGKKLLFIVGIGSTYKLNFNIWTTSFLYEINSYRKRNVRYVPRLHDRIPSNLGLDDRGSSYGLSVAQSER